MKNGKVMAYASRHLKIHEKNYPAHDIELVAVLFSLKYGATTCMVFMMTYSLTTRAFNMCSLRKNSILDKRGA